jgi:hypothetical protein
LKAIESSVRSLRFGTVPIHTIVTHENLDTDALVCIYMILKGVPLSRGAKLRLVRAGESLAADDPGIIHVDTGQGEFDQHGKGLQRSCSAALVYEGLGLDPSFLPLVEMAARADNVEEIAKSDLHYQIIGWKYDNYNSQLGGVNWKEVMSLAFSAFDIIVRQEKVRIESGKLLAEKGRWTTLENGIKVCHLGNYPRCREAAFEAGADFVTWTQFKRAGRYNAGVQRHRKCRIGLASTVASLRKAELTLRGLPIPKRLDYLHSGNGIEWFLHDSLALILCGSKTKALTGEEFTKLPKEVFEKIVETSLSAVKVVKKKGK